MRLLWSGIRISLEFLRFIVILILLGSLLGGVSKLIYNMFGINLDHTVGGWMVGCAILISITVFYKNRFQKTVFYKGHPFSPTIRKTLLFVSLMMFIMAPFFS